MLMTNLRPAHSQSIEDFLTIGEAMELSGYKDQYLRRMAKTGMVRAIKRGHFWLIERASLEAYVTAAQRTDDKRYGPRDLNECHAQRKEVVRLTAKTHFER